MKDSRSAVDMHARQEDAQTGKLTPVSMVDLYDNVYENRRPIVRGMIYAGAYLFAGAPKVGKSFFMAQLAYHVSIGRALWGYEVKQSTVLYLTLEDDEKRLQQRLYKMFGIQQVSDNLYFSTKSSMLSGGLEVELEAFLHKHNDTGLIIIDTLQKIRGNDNDNTSYAKDYETVSRLKKFADNHDVCVILVHHTRKQQSDDAFDMISGTNGLMGAADCSLVLHKEKRTSNKAILEMTGRDQTDQKIYLKRDEERLVWQLEKVEVELWKEPLDPILEAIIKFISFDNPCWIGSPSELTKILAIDIAPNGLSQMLNIRAGRLAEEYGIRYEKGRNHSGRFIKLYLSKK